ncbi:MAG: nucleotidyltransferase [Lachnospiraceae bacterium]|nr:nucleotidyltransferase [Lachnospiraceae bacterium]
MKTVGIIAEFNPFHNGHAYLLKEARKITGADAVVVVMSGNYVQRGTPALLSKYARIEMALSGGADLVIELPVFSACSSAEYFAEGAVRLLTDLGIDTVCFGSESGELDALASLAQLFAEEPEQYRALLKASLASGANFPTARRSAIASLLPELVPLLDEPNNLLAIEYLKAIYRLGSSLRPYTIQRAGSGYHEAALTNHSYPSATAIRNFFYQDAMPGTLISFADYMPLSAVEIMEREFFRTFPVTEQDYSNLLALRLLSSTKEELAELADVGPELAARLYAHRFDHIQYSDFAMQLKTKELTYTRICRALLHIILGITANDLETFRAFSQTPYMRVLGFTQAARPLLKELAGRKLPLITKPARAGELISPEALPFWQKELFASELYRQISYSRYHTEQPSEYTHEILILE